MSRIQKLHKASIRLITKKTFWNTYDHLGRVLVMNFLAVLLSLSLVGIPLAALGLYAAAQRMVNYEDVEMRDFWRYWPKYLKRSLLLMLILIIIFVVLVVNLRFYFVLLGSKGLSGVLGIIVSLIFGLMVWLFLFFCMFALYVYPVLIAMDTSVKETLQNSFFMMMDNLKITVYLLVNSLIWLGFGFISAGLIALFLSFGVIAVISSTAVRELLKQYKETQPDEAEEVRGFRDLIKPWG